MSSADLVYSLATEHLVRASSQVSFSMPKATDIGIGVKGLDNRYQMINRTMEKLFGKNAEQVAGRTDSDLFPPDVVTQIQRADQKIIAGAVVVSEEFDMSINGVPARCLWLNFPLLASDGRIHSIGTVVVDISRTDDITEMQHSLEQLRETNRGLQKDLAELDRLASTDKLTGAWNRRRLEETVISEMDRLKRYDHPLSALIIDIDFFKRINDEHGHVAGDQVLEQLAAVIRPSLRATDSLTRWGGEEFVVLSPNTTLSTMAMLAERLRKRIAKAVFPGGKIITVSIGAAECLLGESWEDWLRRADAALYRAKAGGRNQVQVDRDTPQRVGVGEKISASFVQLTWHSAYECGNSVVDDQHRMLFRDANNLIFAILSERPTDEVSTLIATLIHDAVQHFKDEEQIFTAAGFPDAAEHAAMHRQLIDSAAILVGRFNAGTLALGELFQFLAHDVVARHLLKADREFFPYLGNSPL